MLRNKTCDNCGHEGIGYFTYRSDKGLLYVAATPKENTCENWKPIEVRRKIQAKIANFRLVDFTSGEKILKRKKDRDGL